MPNNPPTEFLSLSLLCAIAGWSRANFYILKSEGRVPKTYKINGQVHVRKDDALRWLEDRVQARIQDAQNELAAIRRRAAALIE